MALRWYLCDAVGDGKSMKTAFRPAIADAGISFTSVDFPDHRHFLVAIFDEDVDWANEHADILHPLPPESEWDEPLLDRSNEFEKILFDRGYLDVPNINILTSWRDIWEQLNPEIAIKKLTNSVDGVKPE